MHTNLKVTQEVVDALEEFVKRVTAAESRWRRVGHLYYQNDAAFRHAVITARREFNERLGKM